ncbi:MAG: glycosyltransferase family 4 protein [Nanoarchaeota archaeon]
MKILEVCPYSAGICGVFTRVLEESKRLSKLDFEVKIFSSNAVKGSNKIAPSCEKIGKVEVFRFPFKKLGGESFMSWDFEKEALEFEPEIIIAHSYRHLHTIRALKVAEILRRKGKKCKVFLVTHAPFERKLTRTFLQNLIVKFYDFFIGKKTINKFDKIFAITKWEIPYLIKLGVKKEKIEYIPNGISEIFFKQKKSKEENKILFLGRISSIKNLEILISAMPLIKDKNIILEIVGPAEENYLKKLKLLIKSLKLESRIIFFKPIYNLKEKIKKIDSCKIFVLPSKSEGMPQSLIEAMAREKIVVASDILASRDLITAKTGNFSNNSSSGKSQIKDKENGFLFKNGNAKNLAEKINFALSEKNNEKIKKQARKSVENFSWNKVIKKIEKLIH